MSLAEELQEAQNRFAAANPVSLSLHEKATPFLPGGNTRSTLHYPPFPLSIKSGKGCYVTDADGHEYLDLIGEYTAGLFGHSNKEILSALKSVLDNGINLTSPGANDFSLAETICSRFPSIDLVRFTNSGTEANLMAIAAAKIRTGREKVLVFSGAYHGGVLLFNQGVHRINVPHEWVLAEYDDIEGTRSLITSETACVLVEPMLGSGGCIPASVPFLRMLRERTRETSSILIFDEVMTSRLSIGGRQHLTGITPDMTTLGKYLGGGMTFGAFGGKKEVMDLFDPRKEGAIPHAGTFNNNVLSMVAGNTAMSLWTPGACERINNLGDSLRRRLNALSETHDSKLRVTGLGSLMTFHFSDVEVISVRDVHSSDQRMMDLFWYWCVENGVYLARRGFVALMLPVGEEEADRVVCVVKLFLDKYSQLVRRASRR